MRKFIFIGLLTALMFTIPSVSNAFTWCFGPHDCQAKKMTLKAGEGPVMSDIAIMPTWDVGGNGVWLIRAKGLYVGPAFTAVKLFDLITIQGQYAIQTSAAATDVPNHFYGANGVVTVADIIKKFGGNPGSFILTFNPSLGITGGWKSREGWDYGPVVNAVNVDLEKVCTLVGLCK